MNNTNPIYLYVGSAIFIILIVILIAQSYKRRYCKTKKSLDKYVAIDTRKGLINVPVSKAIAELSSVRDKLRDNSAGVINTNSNLNTQVTDVKSLDKEVPSCKELSFLIDESMRELKAFIDKNPYNAKALCTLDTRSNVLQQQMEDSINPHAITWEETYRTLLEWEDFERDMTMQDKFKYLLDNLDMLISMLRSDVCNYGRIDLAKLYDILNKTNESICATGIANVPVGNLQKITEVDDVRNALSTDKRLIEPMAVSKAREISYAKGQNSSYANESVENPLRGKPSHEAFGSINEVPYAMYSDRVNRVDSNNYSRDNVANRVAGNYGYGTSDGLSGDNYEIAEDANNYSELIGQATVVNRAIGYHSKKSGSTLLDASLEGLVERDILGYTPPGHLVRKLYDPADHYTVNINSCLGKTIPDDELWAQCTSYDMKLRNALDGDASGMICGL